MLDPALTAATPAATLVLVREHGCEPPELLMVERAAGMAFAGGALVFPGGRIDQSDRDLAAALGTPSQAPHVAAIRETLEETAIAVGLDPQPSPTAALALQQRLLGGTAFAALLDSAGLTLDPAALIPFARWVPELEIKRRFDTLFLIARAPSGDWSPNPQPGECADAMWISAAGALDRAARGEAQLIFPTRRNLERLARHASFVELAADAAAHPIVPITPWFEDTPAGRIIRIADDLGYPITSEALGTLWRG